MIKSRKRPWLALLLVIAGANLLLVGCSLSKNESEPRWLVVATSQELADAGLPQAIGPSFEANYHVQIKWLPVSSSQAIEYAKSDSRVDVLLVSPGDDIDAVAGPAPTIPDYNAPVATPAPTPIVQAGVPVPTPTALDVKYLLAERQIVFWSPLVLVGPPSDPLHLSSAANIAKALKTLGEQNGPFLVAGQEPGIAKLEEIWWKQVGTGEIKSRGQNYKIFDGDFHSTLTTAEANGSYTIVPLDIYLTYHQSSKSSIIFSKDVSLFLPYESIVHNSTRCADCDLTLSRQFIDYLTGKQGQAQILALGQAQFKQSFFQPADYKVYRPSS